MKTQELKEYYIDLLMNTLSESEYKKEAERTKTIICSIKPQRTIKEQVFIDLAEKLIYSGNRAIDLIIKDYGFNPQEEQTKFVSLFPTFQDAKKEIKEYSKKAYLLIESKWKENTNKLSKLITQ